MQQYRHGNIRGFCHALHFAHVFGITEGKLLAEYRPDLLRRITEHDDSRLGGIYSGYPRPIVAEQICVAVIFFIITILSRHGAFAEIPDVAIFVLGVPILCVFDDTPSSIDNITDFTALYTKDYLQSRP